MSMKTTLFLITIFAAISGCKDSSLPASTSATVDRAKSLVTRERLPETSVDTAVLNHGLPTLATWAEEGDKKAQHFLAVAYISGTATPKNFELSEKWARRAANQGSSPSQYLMGMIHKDAAGGNNLLALEPNLILSYMWFSLAAAQGHESARSERDKLESVMAPEWVNRSQALASVWRQCADSACQDKEPDPGPSPHCKNRPTSVLCP